MDFFQNVLWCFLTPLAEKTHKNAIQENGQNQSKKRRYLPTSFSDYLPDTRRFQFIFSSAPLEHPQEVAPPDHPRSASTPLWWRPQKPAADHMCALHLRHAGADY
jgi:hypothetical protein